MAIELYNFIWTTSPSLPRTLPVRHLQTNVVNTRIKPTRGVILFPALLTPAMHVARSGSSPSIELLIATEDALTAEMVNHQLKLSKGLQPHKPYSVRTLFGGAGGAGSTGKIVVEEAGAIDTEESRRVSTHSAFEGVLQKDIGKALDEAGCKKLYRVLITDVTGLLAAACGDRKCPSRSEIAKANGSPEGLRGVKFCCYALPPVAALSRYRKRALTGDERDIHGGELSDKLIVEMTRRRFEDLLPPGHGYHSFAVGRSDVDPHHFDGHKPIQSYHPLYVFSGNASFEHANIGHLSDVHVNCRWQILKKNPARVVENSGEVSPRVGDLLADNNQSFVSVLRQLVLSDSHLIVVGGDLIDHIRNAHWHKPKPKPSAREVWDAVNIDEASGGYTMKSYPPGIDLIAFYSLIMAVACHSKPVFVLTGNHDCYYSAFGISPRIKAKGRANEGIPADLNMTMYEALLAFGPSGGLISGGLSSMIPFKPPWFEWFYTVLTPFRDYRYKLPKQSLVACAWGYGEDILTDLPGSQGMGHLGRSDDAITDLQLELIEAAAKERSTHKVILTTHFTVASYKDNIPMLDGSEKHTPGTLSAGALRRNDFEWGTYEQKHSALNQLLDQNAIQLVLTGHTHRRGVYRITGRDGGDLKIELHVPPIRQGIALPGDLDKPPIVVSDSSGPYPRSNRQGEFMGWGSDKPAGTLVMTDDAAGHIAKILPVQAERPKPRAAVAVDYVDLLESQAFAPHLGLPKGCCMMVALVEHRRVKPRRVYQYLYMNLSDHLKAIGVYAEGLSLVSMDRRGTTTIPTQARGGIGSFHFEVAAEHTDALRAWLDVKVRPARFLAIKLGIRRPVNVSPAQFEHLKSQYDWSDRWYFEAKVKRYTSNLYNSVLTVPKPYNSAPVRWYSVTRPKRKIKVLGSGWFGEAKYKDVPNYRWRERNFPSVYVGDS